MKYVVIEAVELEGVPDYHAYLSALFGFPDYYGRNLDALNDCLSEICEDTTIAVAPGFESLLDGYGGEIMKIFEAVASRSAHLHIKKT